jgi:hypothetical protein
LIAAGFLVGVRLEQGRHAGLEPVLLELVEKMPRLLGDRNIESIAARYNLGCYYALTGQRGRALRLLREAIDRGFRGGADLDASLASLRGDPQFGELVELEHWNDSSNWHSHAIEASLRMSRGDMDEAERIFRGILAGADRTAQPTHEVAMLARGSLGVLYTRLHRYAELEEVARSWPPHAPGDDAEWYLYQCDLHRGDKATALPRIEGIRASQPEWTAGFAYMSAVYHAVQGDREASRRWLAIAVDRKLVYGWWATWDVAFDPYRDDSQFQALIRRLARDSGEPYWPELLESDAD